jgi:hypothetical protein
MNDDIRIQIDDAAVAEMFSDWSSDIGRYIAGLTDAAEITAKSLAPVSSRGSKYAPPGTLKRQVHSVYSHSADGSVMGLVGISRSSTKGYPYNFIFSASGRRRVANQWGHYGSTHADNAFLFEALNVTTKGLF